MPIRGSWERHQRNFWDFVFEEISGLDTEREIELFAHMQATVYAHDVRASGYFDVQIYCVVHLALGMRCHGFLGGVILRIDVERCHLYGFRGQQPAV